MVLVSRVSTPSRVSTFSQSVALLSGPSGVPVGLKSASSGSVNGNSRSSIAYAFPSLSNSSGNGSPQ